MRSETVSSWVLSLFILEPDLEPLLARQIGEVGFVHGGLPDFNFFGPASADLALDHAAHALEQIVFQDALLIGQILADPLELGLFDGQRARVLLDAVTGEHPHVDHRAIHAGRHPQRGVLHVGRLFAEYRPQQLLLRRQLGLTLRRDLAHQNVAGAHFGADEGDARFIELGQVRSRPTFGNVRRDFLGPQLGVARDARELFDVDGRETVFLDHALGDEDGILEVVAVPRHEGHQQVLTERELAQIRGGAVRQHVAAVDGSLPHFTSGRWLMQVFWLERVYFVSE